jgi:voltage-gated potassium channel
VKNRLGIGWQAIIIFLIILDAIVLFLSVIANLMPVTMEYISIFDLIVSIILLIGFLIVMSRTKEKYIYIKNSWHLILVFIPIYYIAMSVGLPSTLIILKILIIIKILALYLFAQKFAKQVIKYQEQTRLVYALAFFLTVLFLCSFIFYRVEHGVNPEVATYEDSLWFILQTITTVGYGDIIPVTGIGRLMGVISMFSALFLTSIITSVATFSLIQKFRTKTDSVAKRTRQSVEIMNNKLDGINNRLGVMDNSNDIKDIKNDINDLKSEIEDLKDLIKEKKLNS